MFWGARKRPIFKTSALLLMFLFSVFSFIGCGGKSSDEQSNAPVKIGLLVPYTGVFASCGDNITRGAELYFDEVEWKAGGREIKLIKEDTEMKGQVGLQKTRRLVESEKVDILTGVVSSTVAYAIRDYVVGHKIPFIIANAGASDLTRDKGSKYIFRVSFSNGQYEYPLGVYAYKKMNLRKITVMAPDYAAGREKANGFMAGFRDAGGEIVQEIYPQLGTSDFGPYLTNIKPADAVWVHFSGNDSIAFVKQYDEYGLKEKMPLLTSGDTVDESSLPSQGDSALGIVSALHYSANLNTPENTKFVNAYQAKYDEEPNMFAEQGYVAARVIVESLNAIRGDVINAQKLLSKEKPNMFAEQGYLASRLIVEILSAINNDVTDSQKLLLEIGKVKFEAPRGPFEFHPQTQNVIFNTYIQKVEKKGGKLVNSIIETIPEVTDQWVPKKGL